MAKPNLEASAHYLMGALEKFLAKRPIPVGHHDLCNVEGTFKFPAVAFVDRAEGTNGKGFNEGKPIVQAPLEITLEATKLYLERHNDDDFRSPGKRQSLWESCLRDALKGMKTEFVFEAIDALAVVQAEQPIVEPLPGEPKKTPAKRTGDLEVEFSVSRAKKTTDAPVASKVKKARTKGAA